ncbi:Ltp family lipoprotein [Levilactobacillus bambusae]|uniref:Putative host cell surface-exposed lipoprotein Ltp-like HTH region domain-containing protein n=1 Tax=Levilactobacillus bambusae TaxID=2024736 RepID=A0A2V1N1A5_9LACO|nr:Ltp family lipoprotein [Levilactobacillus bambusae]PWG01071.1 hypothetical protein DCM90_02540 [Levilactobacillus bambusae]
MAKKTIKGDDGKTYVVQEKRPWYKNWAFWMGLTILLLIVGIGFSQSGKVRSDTQSKSSVTQTTAVPKLHLDKHTVNDTESLTGTTVPQATVKFVSDSEATEKVKADLDGNFSEANLQPDTTYTVMATKDGQTSHRETVTVTSATDESDSSESSSETSSEDDDATEEDSSESSSSSDANDVDSESDADSIEDDAEKDSLDTEKSDESADESGTNSEPSPNQNTAALHAAQDYADMDMSEQAVRDQLTSSYGEDFSESAADYAMSHLTGVDWNQNALNSAKSYQEDQDMSVNEIRDQLTSSYGENFTDAQADYAISHLDD